MCVSKGWAVYMKCSSQDQVFIGKICQLFNPKGGGGIYLLMGGGM